MKNNKGFAISSVVYAMLILFLGLILLILGNLASRKAMFDKEKNEILMRFNGYEGTLCTLVEGGAYDIGSKYECDLGDNETKTFYVLEVSKNNVSLIMNANIDSNGKAITSINIPADKGLVAWSTKDDYLAMGGTESDWNKICANCGNSNLGPVTVEATLKANTKTWTRLTANQITLPTGQQIATAGGDTEWTESYDTETKLSTWLYDNLNGTTNAVSGVYGYWTSSPYVSYAMNAWFMSYNGFLDYDRVDDSSYSGIRPVITILKSQLKIPKMQKYENGEVVYFNVTTGEKCTSSDYTETQSNTGTKSGCMKFYAFNDDGGDKVNLILDHNTTAVVAWNSSGSNGTGPKEVLTQLKTDTASWKGTETPANYTMDQTGQKSNAKYTINYSSYKARLITAQEIAQITGNTSWNEKVADSSNYYFFDSKITTASSTCKSGNTSGCKYGWLYDRTRTNCTTYGCLNNSDKSTYGYWTSSSRAVNTNSAWHVFFTADVVDAGASSSNIYGVRPVIEVLRKKIMTSEIQRYKNGEEVYFNVTTGEKCTSSNYTKAQSNTGTKSGCMKFYAFNDDGVNTVNLILDHNTTATVAWNSSGSNEAGPKEVLTQLKTDTSSWKGTETPANYTMDQTGQTNNANYTIDYSNYKARLITANEVAIITGNISWDEKTASNWYYFDSKTTTQNDTCKSGNTSGCKYGWLYDRTGTGCTTYGCLNNSDKSISGYWTASSRAGISTLAWDVYSGARVSNYNVNSSGDFGVRPVIVVLRSKLS